MNAFDTATKVRVSEWARIVFLQESFSIWACSAFKISDAALP